VQAVEILRIIALLASGICVGLGAVGPGLGIGVIGAKGLDGIAENKKQEGPVLKTMLIGMSIASTTGIYSLVVGLLLIYVVSNM
jgi:F-type H+-transporting ATPase subunit c